MQQEIKADAAALYQRVSDVTRMSEWSPETTSCRWLKGATGPAAGARFKGANRSGWRRWSTTCTVVAAEPGERFAFDVTFARVPISRWEYTFSPDGDRTIVTERWIDHRPNWMRKASGAVMGVRDREAHNRAGMEKTLEALRVSAES